MADTDPGEVLRVIREAATVPIPEQPRRSEFATEDLFVQAWDDWQAEALTRAVSALDTITSLVVDSQAPAAVWTPGDLLSVSMLRAAVARAEHDPTGSGPYSPYEVDRVRELLQRTNPEVTVAVAARAGAPGWTGWAWDATHWLPPGVYDAVGVHDDQRYRLVVGPAGERVAGEASAAFRVGDADRTVVDRVATSLARFAPSRPAGTLDEIRVVVEHAGRDLGDAGSAIMQAAHVEQAVPATRHYSEATLRALRDRARQINGDALAEDHSPAAVDVPAR